MSSPATEETELSPSAPDPVHNPRPHLRQFAIQAVAALVVLSLAWPYYGLRNEALPWPESAFAIGSTALLIAIATHQPWWWRVIHTVFAPLAWVVAGLAIDPGWFLLAFALLLLVYRGALNGQVPLYLSNAQTASALAELVADRGEFSFVDLGAGIGSVVCPLARAMPGGRFTGIENAPATWFVGRLRTAGMTNCDWRLGDIWQVDLARYDVVYAFLSPAPMPALWQKACAEMTAGSLLVSNSFPVPGVAPSHVVEVDDVRRTLLYCYRL